MSIAAWTSMLSGLLLLCAGFAVVSSAGPKTVIFQNFNSNLSLICNHGFHLSEISVLYWQYLLVPVLSETRGMVVIRYLPNKPLSGLAVHNNTLVSFDLESGNAVVREVECYENQIYKCWAAIAGVQHTAFIDVYLG